MRCSYLIGILREILGVNIYFYGLKHHIVDISVDITDAGQTTKEDIATQLWMLECWVLQYKLWHGWGLNVQKQTGKAAAADPTRRDTQGACRLHGGQYTGWLEHVLLHPRHRPHHIWLYGARDRSRRSQGSDSDGWALRQFQAQAVDKWQREGWGCCRRASPWSGRRWSPGRRMSGSTPSWDLSPSKMKLMIITPGSMEWNSSSGCTIGWRCNNDEI